MSTSRKLNFQLLLSELTFTASRSSGAGGQNVNKVNTKVSLRFSITESQTLTVDEKEVLLNKLAAKLTSDGELIISSQEKRSQLQNKEVVIAKFEKLLAKAFEKRKSRKATKPTKSSVKSRLTGKKLLSEKKQWRQKPE
jgi:ribosome-associated protein